jgi:hypothetical protein
LFLLKTALLFRATRRFQSYLGQGLAAMAMQLALPLQVEPDQSALSQDVASQRSTRIVWTGFGVAVLMLIGVSVVPLASHSSAKPSSLLPEVAFNPSLPALSPGGIRLNGLRSAGLPVVRRPTAVRAQLPNMQEPSPFEGTPLEPLKKTFDVFMKSKAEGSDFKQATRRGVLLAGFGAGAATLALPTPALAQRSKMIPRQSAEATANIKEFQLSKPGEETEAFKEAEKRRIAGNNGAVGPTPKEETAEQTMARLGIQTYGEALASGKPDPCGPGSFVCGRGK